MSQPDLLRDGDWTPIEYLDLLATTLHRRVRMLSLIGLGAFAIGTMVALVFGWLFERSIWSVQIMAVLCASLTVLSAGVCWLVRHRRPDRRQLLTLGLGYVVLASAAMAAAEVLLRQGIVGTYEGVPGLCIWIVLFPLIIPCLPWQALLTALLSALLLPVAYRIGRFFGQPPLDWDVLIAWQAPALFCAGLAYAASIGVHRMAKSLHDAQERNRQLGSYQISAKLGSGGMGQVWLGHHRLLDRPAAIKVISPLRSDQRDPDRLRQISQRFEREARAIAQLRAPETVRIYDYGIDARGDLFYAMEYVDGIDLESLVELDGPQAPDRVVAILAGVCRALAEAHEQGLIHRDVKPGNIMLGCRPDGMGDCVKVLDFGLVGVAHGAAGQVLAEGGHTGIAGTPGYIAPETLYGSTPPDPRSDLYGLGAVGFWLLTGRTLFPTGDGGEDLVAHSIDPPPSLSACSPMQIPAVLRECVERCLAKRPEERPPSAAVLADDLSALLGELQSAEAVGGRWWRERWPELRRDRTVEHDVATVTSLRAFSTTSTVSDRRPSR